MAWLDKLRRVQDAVAELEREEPHTPGEEDHLHLHIGGRPTTADQPPPPAASEGGGGAGGDPVGQLSDRCAAIERRLEIMEAQHEEMNDLLEELAGGGAEAGPAPPAEEPGEMMDWRDRIRDRARDMRRRHEEDRKREEDRRASDAKHDEDRKREEDAKDRRRRRSRDRFRRRLADAMRLHEEDARHEEDRRSDDWREEDRLLRRADDDTRREDCAMDAIDRAEEDMRRASDSRRRRRASDAEKPNSEMHDPASKTSSEPDKNRDIEGNLEIEAPAGTGDRARRARDSAYLDESFQHAIAMAEVLAPGMRFPAYNRAAPPGKTLQAIHAIRQEGLRRAHTTDADLRGAIDGAIAGGFIANAAKLSVADTRTLFESVAQLARSRNNAGGGGAARTGDHRAAAVPGGPGLITMGGAPPDMDEYQKQIDAFWAKEAQRGGRAAA